VHHEVPPAIDRRPKKRCVSAPAVVVANGKWASNGAMQSLSLLAQDLALSPPLIYLIQCMPSAFLISIILNYVRYSDQSRRLDSHLVVYWA